MKGLTQLEYLTVISIYIRNNRPSKYIQLKLTKFKGEADSIIKIAQDFNNSISIMYRTKQKVSKETKESKQENNTKYQIDLVDMYRTLYTVTKAHILLKCP